VLSSGELDLVMIGHAHLADPHYTYRPAMQLGVEKAWWATLPPPYAHWLASYRGLPTQSKDKASVLAQRLPNPAKIDRVE
jgi:hypothetical protein